METLQIDRRRIPPLPSSTCKPVTAEAMRQGLILQASLGTVAALEYLKAQDVCGAVRCRILSGGRRRAADQAALGQNNAAHTAEGQGLHSVTGS